MFCPNCGQEKVSPDTNFCSRCGFLLSGTAELLTTGGVIPDRNAQVSSKALSPRRRGIRQGLFMFLLTFLVAPLIGLISVALDRRPYGAGIAIVILFIGGLLRMAYALMFEESFPAGASRDDFLTAAQSHMGRPTDRSALPPQRAYPATVTSVGNWRDTNDLEPRSVTEGTTKLLENEERP